MLFAQLVGPTSPPQPPHSHLSLGKPLVLSMEAAFVSISLIGNLELGGKFNQKGVDIV